MDITGQFKGTGIFWSSVQCSQCSLRREKRGKGTDIRMGTYLSIYHPFHIVITHQLRRKYSHQPYASQHLISEGGQSEIATQCPSSNSFWSVYSEYFSGTHREGSQALTRRVIILMVYMCILLIGGAFSKISQLVYRGPSRFALSHGSGPLFRS